MLKMDDDPSPTCKPSPRRLKKLRGYQPRNCGNPEHESPEEDQRKAYREVEKLILKDGCNCGTIGPDNRVKAWRVTALPVVLVKVDRNITFFYEKKLMVKFSEPE